MRLPQRLCGEVLTSQRLLCSRAGMRPLTPVETAVLVSLGGSLLAVVVPSFIRNVHASYVSEATNGVAELAARAAARVEAAGALDALPESAPLTPSSVPRGVRVKDPPGTWEHPTWRALAFSFELPHAYSFQFDSERAPPLGRFRALAHGDLDGDGQFSTIELDGSVKPGAPPVMSALDVVHETE